MRLRLFRAPNLAAAMAQVRRELGPDALLLSSRRVGEGVEVSAAIEDDEGPAPLDVPVPAARPAAHGRTLADQLAWHGVERAMAARLTQGDLAATITAEVAFAPLEPSSKLRPLLLVGPPGAGKTLTVARLATRMVMAGCQPAVLTADGRRAAAAEQLAGVTRLLGLTLTVCQPDTMARALTRVHPDAPVLIDTTGLDPFDPVDRDELAALAEAAKGSLALVLPAGLDPAEARDIAEAFRDGGARHLVATRLDTARRLGSVLSAAATGLALAEAGIGPGVADGLVPFEPAYLVRRLKSPGGAPSWQELA